MSVSLEGVTKTYEIGKHKVDALNELDVNIEDGEFITIMGPSGSGKSTFLNVLGGLDKPTSGIIMVDGIDITQLDDNGLTNFRRDKVGFIFQQFNLIPILTANENVEMPLIFKKDLSKDDRDSRVEELMNLVGLEEEFGHHKPNELSGGQQQRVSIARALANDPSFILADEPTGNLDTRMGVLIMDLLKELNMRGKMVIVVSHDPRLKEYSDRTLNLVDGTLAGG